MAVGKKIKVLIVDDSALVRSILTEIFNSDERIDVVGTASDPLIAREKIKQLNPDVLTLDIEMPKMDGITFLKKLMRLRPMPVIMISTLTEKGASATLECLELGAFDYVSKPKDGARGLSEYSASIIEKIVCAAKKPVNPLEKLQYSPPKKIQMPLGVDKIKPNFLVAIGASTGGTEAIKELLMHIPANCPPIVISQHIPAGFSTSYAKRLDGICPMKVYEAYDGQKIETGCAYLAHGDNHLLIRRSLGGYICELSHGDLVNRHRPSVEVMYDSVVEAAGTNSLGVLLTGMGRDGAEALLRMRQAGCQTVVQDEESSVVWGMPGAAFAMGAAERALSLPKIAKFIINYSYIKKASLNSGKLIG